MLSIRFGAEREWWVSGAVFDRLLQAALDSGDLPSDLEDWRHFVDANGGFNVERMEPSDANRLKTALRSTAAREFALLENRDSDPAAETYRTSLLKLLQALSPHDGHH
jgi:hypothetical protein